ncbi:MAG: hypothetical protein IJV07_04570 [Alphaproteobacteria bacterium]|nr:hypothetical protein [Alphaproteobacteria bacterium]
MTNDAITDKEFYRTVALFIAKGSERNVRKATDPWKGKAELDIFRDGCVWYGCRVVETPLLAAIDSDDVLSVADNLKAHQIPINQPYMLNGGTLDAGTTYPFQTFLHRSIESGSMRVFRYLLEHGADLTLKDQNGHTVPEAIMLNPNLLQENRRSFGKRLVDAGLTDSDLQQIQDKYPKSTSVRSLCRILRTYIQNKTTYRRIATQKRPMPDVAPEKTRV